MPSRSKSSAGKPARLPYSTIDEKLCFALYSSSLAMLQQYKPMLAAIGLTYPQYLVMLVLWEGDGVSIKHLAERLGQDPGSVTPLVKRLEESGFLVRQRDAHDERNLNIELTRSGRALQDKAEAASLEFALACRITPTEGEDLRDRLAALAKTLRAAS